MNVFSSLTEFPAVPASSLTSPATMGYYVSLAIFLIAMIFLALGAFFGIIRGFGKSVVRFITVVLSAIASFIAVGLGAKYFEGMFVGKSLSEVILTFMPSYETDVAENLRNLINCFDAETAERIVLIAVYLVAIPIAFIACFFVLKLVTMIIYWIFSAVLGLMGKRRGFFARLFGMLVGAVQGLVICFVVLLPVSGFVSIAAELREPLTAQSVPEQTRNQVEEFYTQWLDAPIENPVLKSISAFGGKMLFSNMVTATVEDEKTDMSEEAKSLADIFVDALPLASCDWVAPDESSEAALRSIAADLEGDKYVASIISGLLRGAARAIDTGALNVPLDEPYKSLVMEVAAVFLDSNADNVDDDLNTVLNVYFILTDNGILSAFGDGAGNDVIDMLIGEHDGERVITKITAELDKNPHTHPISTALTRITVVALSDSLGLGEDATETFENVKSGVKGVLAIDRGSFATEEEYTETVSTLLDATLSSNGIELEDEIIDGMAQYVADNYADVTEITDQDINDALLSYYDAYANYIANGGSLDDIPTP